MKKKYLLISLVGIMLINPLTFRLIAKMGSPTTDWVWNYELDAVFLFPFWGMTMFVAIGLQGLSLSIFQRKTGILPLIYAISATGMILSSNILLAGYGIAFRWIAILVTMLLWARVILGKDRQKGPRLKAIALSLIFALGIAECATMLVKKSHVYNGTLASRTWFASYWQENEQGFRDKTHGPFPKDKPVLLFFGDSFTAGHGIPDPKDRFSDIVQAQNPDWEVRNMAISGQGVDTAISLLKIVPTAPSKVVYVWFSNDPEAACVRRHGETPQIRPYTDLPRALRYWVRHSYLLDFIYWRFPHTNELEPYDEWTWDCFQDEAVMEVHLQEISTLQSLSESMGADFLLVVLPNFASWEYSDREVAVLTQGLQAKNIPFLDTSPDFPPGPEWWVNSQNPHANEAANQVIARVILERLQLQNSGSGKVLPQSN